MNYKRLEDDITKSGFRYRLIRREGLIAIYHKTALEGTYHPHTHDAGFEVIKIQEQEERTFPNGTTQEPSEAFPSPEMWGPLGRTYTNLYDADCRFEIWCGRMEEPKKEVVEVAPAESVKAEEPKTRRPRGSGPPELSVIPVGEFTTKELAAANSVDYPIAFNWLKVAVTEGKVKIAGERKVEGQRGIAPKTYTKAA